MIAVATIETSVYKTIKEGIAMQLSVLMTLGFLGFAPGSFDDGGSNPMSAGVGAPPHGDFNAPAVLLLSDKPRAPVAPAGITFPNFKPIEFPFVTTIPDDGTGKGGGYQVARVNLQFTRYSLPVTVITWFCPFTVAMPLRTEFMGKVDANRAATMSAGVANVVVAGIDYKLPQGIFCERFIVGMRATFTSMYPFLGASVIK